MAAPVLAVTTLVLGPSPDVPYIDDYDAIGSFLRLYDDTPSAGGRLQLLLAPHNEHMMALPRAAALATRGLYGYLDFGTLNALGSAWLLLLLCGLFLAFRPGTRAADKLLPFAPAALLLVHPAFHMMFRSPTTSHSGFGVAACAALACVALDRGGPRRLALAGLLAIAATLTLANGLLIVPVGLVVLALRRRWKQCAVWAAAGTAMLAVYFGALDPPAARAELLEAASQPGRVVAYLLNFIGCGPGFRRPGVSLLAGALVLSALAGAFLKGLPQRSPALFGVALFLLGSALANALARAPLGADLPLLQPRYAFYSSALAALAYLSWAEVAPTARRAFVAALLGSAGFCAASFYIWGDRVATRSERLAQGYEQWWSQGDGGLFHPDFRSADAILLHGLEAGWLRLPPDWLERHAAWPIPRDAPVADQGVRYQLDVVNQDAHSFYVSGWARAGGSTRGQQVEIVLLDQREARVFPAVSVVRADLDPSAATTPNLARTGFRALVPKQALPPGPYRLGILVRRAGREHLSYAPRPVQIRGGS